MFVVHGWFITFAVLSRADDDMGECALKITQGENLILNKIQLPPGEKEKWLERDVPTKF